MILHFMKKKKKKKKKKEKKKTEKQQQKKNKKQNKNKNKNSCLRHDYSKQQIIYSSISKKCHETSDQRMPSFPNTTTK